VSLMQFLVGLNDVDVRAWVIQTIDNDSKHEKGIRVLALNVMNAKAGLDEIVEKSGLDIDSIMRVMDSWRLEPNLASIENKVRVANVILDALFEREPRGENDDQESKMSQTN